MALPLDGVRVTDLTMFWAGPFATQFLGYLGAQVIKIEPAGRGDSVRFQGSGYDNFWEWAPIFNGTNVNKLGVTLDLSIPEGVDLLRRLISISDVVAENFSTRVITNLGIDYDFVRRANPTAVLLSMPGFGHGGPWEHYVGFGPQFEEASGITYISGYPDTEPMTHPAMADPIGGTCAAIAVLTALEHRRRTGCGQYIDFSTTESVAFLNPHSILDYTMNGRVRERNANKHSAWAPHGAFPCRGDDQWVAIAVQGDRQFQALCEAMGSPELAEDPRFADALSRWDNEEALRQHIAAWTRRHTNQEIMDLLQAKGVPAGSAATAATVVDDPHLKARDFFQWIDRPVNGGRRPYIGFPAQLSKTPIKARKATPTVGEDNDYVYGEVLHLSPGEIAGLKERGVISTEVKTG
ncbi:MAG: CoA transferase [Dehalococcoidia bacterium]